MLVRLFSLLFTFLIYIYLLFFLLFLCGCVRLFILSFVRSSTRDGASFDVSVISSARLNLFISFISFSQFFIFHFFYLFIFIQFILNSGVRMWLHVLSILNAHNVHRNIKFKHLHPNVTLILKRIASSTISSIWSIEETVNLTVSLPSELWTLWGPHELMMLFPEQKFFHSSCLMLHLWDHWDSASLKLVFLPCFLP